MKWLKCLVLLFAVLVAVLAIVPFYVSVDDYRPQIERMLTEQLWEPVKLKSLRLAGLPLPHLVVYGIEIVKAEVKVGKIALTPDLWSLLTANKIIRSVKITGLVINQRALNRVPVWIRTDPKAKPADFTVSVQTVQLDDALLQLQHASFGPFDARVTIAAITARDGKFKATVTPVGEKFNIDVQAKGWRLPAGPPILFDELLVKGVATMNDAYLGEVSAKLHGGTVAGKTSIAWKKGLHLQGDYTVSDVELRELVPLFSPKTRVSGRLTARPVFSASAASAGSIADALKLNTPFNVRDGVLQGIDIQKAATNLIQKDQ